MEQQMSLSSYFDFADEDRKYFIHDFQQGRIANYMASMSQNICERYMKHIIDQYHQPDSMTANNDKNNVLRTHSLNKLMKYVERYLGFSFSPETEIELRIIDGFYFSTRYPGEESISVNKNDISHCALAVELCRDAVLSYEETFLRTQLEETDPKDQNKKLALCNQISALSAKQQKSALSEDRKSILPEKQMD